jgi:hypothetical protein
MRRREMEATTSRRRISPGNYTLGTWTIRKSFTQGLHGPRETVWRVYPTDRDPNIPLSKIPEFRQFDTLEDASRYARQMKETLVYVATLETGGDGDPITLVEGVFADEASAWFTLVGLMSDHGGAPIRFDLEEPGGPTLRQMVDGVIECQGVVRGRAIEPTAW